MINQRLNLLITVDVEYTGRGYYERDNNFKIPSSTMDCVIRGKSYGLPFILHTLNKNNLKGSFFIEPFSKFYFGEDQLKNNIQKIKDSNHDIQLHLHPAWLFFKYHKRKSDLLCNYSLNKQTKLIKLGKNILKKFKINPIAFRAGGFAADNNTYKALEANGFFFSSNYNLDYLNEPCPIRLNKKINDIKKLKNIYEIPITNYLIRKEKNGKYEYKHAQICCTPFEKIKKVLEFAYKNNMNCATILLHNFEFIQRDEENWLLNPLKPHMELIANFKNLCSYLNANKDKYNITTFSEFYKIIKKNKIKLKKSSLKIPKIKDIYKSI